MSFWERYAAWNNPEILEPDYQLQLPNSPINVINPVYDVGNPFADLKWIVLGGALLVGLLKFG